MARVRIIHKAAAPVVVGCHVPVSTRVVVASPGAESAINTTITRRTDQIIDPLDAPKCVGTAAGTAAGNQSEAMGPGLWGQPLSPCSPVDIAVGNDH